MPQSRQDFIENNREVLETYSRKVDDKTRPVYGFGAVTPQEAFKAILEDADDFYLPLCFLYLFWDFKDEGDRNFVLQSLESLYFIDDEGNVTDQVMSYVYSYCLCQIDEGVKSYDILHILADECFPPALATMGDGCVANHKIASAVRWYRHAMDHDYLSTTGRCHKLMYRNVSFPKNVLMRVMMLLSACFLFLKFVKIGMKGERALYLDFYSMSYHLNKYWKMPKQKRILGIKEEISDLKKMKPS